MPDGIGSSQVSDDELVFTSREGLPIDNGNFRRLWRIVLAEVGVPYRKPYTTRKTSVRHSLLSGSNYTDDRKIHGKRRKRRTDDRKIQKSQLTKDSNNTAPDYRILTQCLFCNRFHLQEPKPVLSRYCDKEIRPECHLRWKAWKQSLKTSRKEIDTETISPSGF